MTNLNKYTQYHVMLEFSAAVYGFSEILYYYGFIKIRNWDYCGFFIGVFNGAVIFTLNHTPGVMLPIDYLFREVLLCITLQTLCITFTRGLY